MLVLAGLETWAVPGPSQCVEAARVSDLLVAQRALGGTRSMPCPSILACFGRNLITLLACAIVHVAKDTDGLRHADLGVLDWAPFFFQISVVNTNHMSVGPAFVGSAGKTSQP